VSDGEFLGAERGSGDFRGADGKHAHDYGRDDYGVYREQEKEERGIGRKSVNWFPEPYKYWHGVKDGNPSALALYERHYSCYRYADGRERKLFCGPGQKLVLLTEKSDALFVWRKFIDASGERGVNCAVFRNEGGTLSSLLIMEAEEIGRRKWPGERFYTYVDPKKIRSVNPGCCFKCAGWRECGRTKGGLLILEKPGQDAGGGG
jgi:hypothetical protein